MTEFETATIAYQNSSLDLQLYAIWAQVGVGLLHAALIGVGLWMMHRASSDRNKTMDKRHEEAKDWHEQVMNEGRARHEESMTALKELIARTAPPSPPSAAPAG